MTTIEPDTLREQLENGEDVCVVDIRSEADYEKDYIEGSENRPIREMLLSGDVEAALDGLEDLPDREELVLVCDASVASTHATFLGRVRFDYSTRVSPAFPLAL